MGRIPDDELERIKRDNDLVAVVRARGIELRPHGKDLAGRCPFHGPDETPSLVITPGKGLFHCFACDAGGDVIEWTRRTEGVSFRHAVEILRAGGPPPAFGAPPVAKSTVLKLPPPVAFDAEDHELLAQVVAYYHATLRTSPEALAYLKKRGIDHPGAITTFQLGYADRTLGLRLPGKQRADGQAIRERLQHLGVYRDTGREHLCGSLVIPIFDAAGQVSGMYGRKVRDDLRAGTAYHLYLPGPHRGLWNLDALRSSHELILCEALIDALTFWCAGFQNVTASYGVNGFTTEHLEAMKAYGTERVLIAYDRDEAGDRAAGELAKKLAGEGITAFRVVFPHGLDANAYACKVQPASQSLAVLLRAAEYMAGPLVARPVVVAARPASVPSPLPPISPAPASSLAAVSHPAGHLDPIDISDMVEADDNPPSTTPTPPLASLARPMLTAPPTAATPPPVTPPPASPIAPPSRPDIPAEVSEHQVVLHFENRTWRVRGISKNLSFETMRVNLLVGLDGDTSRFHQDTLDLYSAKQRAAFVRTAAGELGCKEDVVKKDVGTVLLKLEALQEQAIRQTLEAKPKAVTLTEQEAEAALELLRDPQLLDRILSDFEKCGVVGEETNKLVGYLAAVSRKLEQPLAVMVQSSSAAGKSALMNAVLAFVPDEERVAYSAMTGQSLFYMGEADLRHKILAIAEEEGASRAAYALKLLQSEGELTIASTGKDPATGRLVTHEYRVEGPAAICMTTTAIDLDEELLNRCLVLTVNEDRAQTRAIHRIQRESQTLDGLLGRRRRTRLLTLHRNAQRLLKALPIYNPYAHQLTFLDDATRTRRDHLKYLGLIATITLLHQYQREHRFLSDDGEQVEHLVVSLEDIATANRLAAEVLGHTLDELPPQSRRFLLLLDQMVRETSKEKALERPEVRFSRADARRFSGWSYPQVRTHLDRLVEMEYLLVHRGSRGQSFVYELLYAGEGQDGQPFLMGLLDVERLRARTAIPTTTSTEPTATTPTLTPSEGGLRGAAPGFDRPLTPNCAPIDPPLRGGGNGKKPSQEKHPDESAPTSSENAVLRTPDPRPQPGRHSLDRAVLHEPATDDQVFPLAAVGHRTRTRP
ncbi:MAG: CHC2 zinc finger domain-containing protein [Thermoanaerobaculaceae bacterium]